jgi:hypothetical protein
MSPRSVGRPPPPPPESPETPEAPLSSRPILSASKAYAAEPPVIRERYRPEELGGEHLIEDLVFAEGARPATLRKPPAPSSGPARLRSETDDPAEGLFDALYELNFVSSAWEAAGMCAETLARVLGARVVVVHVHDVERREIRAVAMHGEIDQDLVGGRSPVEDDLVAAEAFAKESPVIHRFHGDPPSIAPRRFHAIRAPHAVLAAPGLAWGRCVALVEVIDPAVPVDARAARSATYVAERFAEYLAEADATAA